MYVQGDAPFRMVPEDMEKWFFRNSKGEMVPFSSFASAHWEYAPARLERYNGVPSVEILGQPAPGVSSGTAMLEMEKLASQLPQGIGYEWTGLSYQERLSGSQAPALFALSILVVFLCLAALYESWSVPFAVILVVPLGVLGALLFSAAGGLVHFGLLQLGYIAWISALVGMAAGYFGYGLFSGRKNTVHGAILAVVFTMLMIVAAEYFGLAKEIYDVFKDTYEVTFRDALASVPDFLTEAEIRTSVLKDLGIAFVFSILEAVFFIRDAVRKSKAAAAAETEAAAKNPAEF